MKLLETGLKLAEAQQLLPADQDFAILAVREGDEIHIAGVLRAGKHWTVVGEVGKTKAQPDWDWRVGVFGKFP